MPFKVMSRTTIYPLGELAVAPRGTIYRLDTHTARHPVQDPLGNVKCVYIKAMFRDMLVKTYNPIVPVKRNLIQKLKFFFRGTAKVSK